MISRSLIKSTKRNSFLVIPRVRQLILESYAKKIVPVFVLGKIYRINAGLNFLSILHGIKCNLELIQNETNIGRIFDVMKLS